MTIEAIDTMDTGKVAPLEDESVRLNLGAGSTRLAGWTPIDRRIGSEVFPLPEEYTSDSVDEMRASHILEHFHFTDRTDEPSVSQVLSHWVDRLKVGGKISIAVPNMDRINEMRADGDERWMYYLMGGQTDANDVHKSVWTEPTLRQLMEDCGLTRIERFVSDNTDTASHPCSLNLMGIKDQEANRKKNTGKDVRIAAFMTIPRLGWNTHWGCVFDALMPFKIPLRRATGAFWGQCLQNLLEHAIEDKLDWILTIDYDSVITKAHLDRMLQCFGHNDDIHALAAMQARREGETPLVTVEGVGEIKVTGEPIKVTTAHFGLTLIRTECLARIPRPWFFAVPNTSGGYDDEMRDQQIQDRMFDLRRWADIPDENHGRLDADIWFWHVWKQHGFSVYMHPEVRIGHLEEKVLWFDEDMKTRSTYMREFRENNDMPTERKRR